MDRDATDAFLRALFASLAILHSKGEEISELETLARNDHRLETRKAPSNNVHSTKDENEDVLQEERLRMQQPKPFDKVSDAAIRMFYALKELQKKKKKKLREAEDETESCRLRLTSDMGIERLFATPSAFASSLLEFMDSDTQKELFVQAKVNESTGSIWFCSVAYYETCKQNGWWRCHECGAFASDERALWWHQKMKHNLTHSEAIKEVEAERNALSVILNAGMLARATNDETCTGSSDGKRQQKKKKDPGDLQRAIRAAKGGDLGAEFEKCIIEKKIARLPFQSLEYSRRGDVDALRNCTEDVKNCLDSNGASCLHWACGSDSLRVVKYLIEELHFDPNQPQQGKRSYEGRTPLHWAARNGNMRVCKYLLETCKVDVNCKTNDGTSAFAWATWKGEIDIMKLLISFGANPRESANQFGCNASMWACQGDGDNVEVCEYLRSLHVSFRLVNANGHSALHKAAQRGNDNVVDWIIANSRRLGLSYSLHCRKDLEGFRPSDLAKMEDNEVLCAKIERFQRRLQFEEEEEEKQQHEEERVEHGARKIEDDAVIERRHRVRYPPTTFYAAISTGCLDLFREIIAVDPYYAAQDNGAGTPLHFAASYGEPEMMPELLEYGGFINQKDLFGMTPLHRAATLIQKHVVGAEIQEEYDGLVKKLDDIKAFRPKANGEKKENKDETRKQNKATWKRDSQRVKDIEAMFEKPSHLLGTQRALQTYRALLALGADPDARDDILKLTPRELARRDLNTNFASEIADVEVTRRIETLISQMENETKEAPTRSNTRGDCNTNKRGVKNWHALRKRAKEAATQNVEDIRDSFWHLYYAERTRAIEEKCMCDDKKFSMEKQIPVTRYDAEEQDDMIEESEAVSALLHTFDDDMTVQKEAIDGVPGAFLLRNVFAKSTSQILAKYVNQIQPNKYNQTNARRESMAEKIMRANLEILHDGDFVADGKSMKSVLKGFKILAVDPILALSSTDTFYGESRLPVEPVSWSPAKNGTTVLEKMARRIRPYLPLRSGMDSKSGRYLVEDDNLLLDERLRCYRYSEKTCSIPHYDKSTSSKANGKEMSSAYSLIVYLNGTAHLGGETGFFLDSQRNSRKSNSGLTKNCGDGNFPLVEYVASVKGETGDVLLFPHGNKECDADYEHLLHDGREVLAGEPKFLIRTDVMYEKRNNRETSTRIG